MAHNIPKAILYLNPQSIWSAAALLTLEEKGYGDDEVERKVVDISKAENLSWSFLRINPAGTVPTLVVPLENSLAPGVENRYKALTGTKSVVEFLDKSRSVISRTHTTSRAPAPVLSPATIALNSAANSIIALLHSAEADPNLLFYFAALDQASLWGISQTLGPFVSGRLEAINGFVEASKTAEIAPSEKTRKLWAEKKLEAEELLFVYSNASKSSSELGDVEAKKRDAYFQGAHKAWNVHLRDVLYKLDKEMVGPFALGDQLSITDMHLAPWLSRLASLCDGKPTDNGDTIVSKITAKLNAFHSSSAAVNGAAGGASGEFKFPRTFQSTIIPDDGKVDPTLAGSATSARRIKLAVFWDEISGRPSWRRVYGGGLF